MFAQQQDRCPIRGRTDRSARADSRLATWGVTEMDDETETLFAHRATRPRRRARSDRAGPGTAPADRPSRARPTSSGCRRHCPRDTRSRGSLARTPARAAPSVRHAVEGASRPGRSRHSRRATVSHIAATADTAVMATAPRSPELKAPAAGHATSEPVRPPSQATSASSHPSQERPEFGRCAAAVTSTPYPSRQHERTNRAGTSPAPATPRVSGRVAGAAP